MIKKLSSTALAIAIAGNCLADDVPTLKVSKCDGESTVVLSELLSIKYVDSDMVVNMKDGTKLVFALDDIVVMEVGQTSAAISNIFTDASETYVITDLQGDIVSKGNVEKFVLPAQRGVYIVSVGDKSKKIIVK